MAIAKANGATPSRCRQTSFGWESDCPSRTRIPDSRGYSRVPREPAALSRNRGHADALLSWNARLRRVCESKRVPSPRLRFHRWPNRRRVHQQPQGQPGRNPRTSAPPRPTVCSRPWGRGPNRAEPSIAVIPAPAWARAVVASSKRDKSLGARNRGQGPVQRTGPCFARHPGLVARERRRRAGEARGVTLHQPAAVGNARGVRSIVFGLFLTMKAGLHPPFAAWAPTSSPRELGMSDLARGWSRLRAWSASHGPELRLCVRSTTAAVLTLAAAQVLHLPIARWAVLTAVILTQISVGRSLKATIDYLASTLGGAIYAG